MLSYFMALSFFGLWRKYNAAFAILQVSGDFSSPKGVSPLLQTTFFVPLRPLILIGVMVTELIVVWIVAVVAFFVLWAILLKVIKRVSERKHKDDTTRKDADPLETMPEQRN